LNYDLDEASDNEDMGYSRLRKKGNNIVIRTQFDKQKALMKEKEDRRQKYAKYIKEINLPLELDRKELRKEASRLRL
jgi:hypothetical protein